jgi:hypothetical protein
MSVLAEHGDYVSGETAKRRGISTSSPSVRYPAGEALIGGVLAPNHDQRLRCSAHEARISVVSAEDIKHLPFVEAAPFDDRGFSRPAAGRS